MSKLTHSRRTFLQGLGLATGGTALLGGKSLAASHLPATKDNPSTHFFYCLNTSTIRGQELGIEKEMEIAAQAGYDGIEIWINGVGTYLENGGKLSDLRKKAEGLHLTVENAIGFAKWIVDDDTVRAEAMEQLKREMDMLASLGCTRIAAPPAGATDEPGLDLDRAGERYRSILALGDEMGVVPQLEVWGFSQNLHKLSQVLYVAAEAAHPSAKILPDVYHLFKGGTPFDALGLLNADKVDIFHMNDYPDTPAREEMNDSDRVYPGKGIAPLSQILFHLAHSDRPKVLSLELFNRSYWEQDALQVAKEGLMHMKMAVRKAVVEEKG